MVIGAMGFHPMYAIGKRRSALRIAAPRSRAVNSTSLESERSVFGTRMLSTMVTWGFSTKSMRCPEQLITSICSNWSAPVSAALICSFLAMVQYLSLSLAACIWPSRLLTSPLCLAVDSNKRQLQPGHGGVGQNSKRPKRPPPVHSRGRACD